MKSTLQNDAVLRFFKESVMGKMGHRLRQVVLFGSRARVGATAARTVAKARGQTRRDKASGRSRA